MKHITQISRRSFLQQIGAASLGAFALPQMLPSRAFGANDRLNIAVLGCGNRSRQLLAAVIQAGENVIALCDVHASQIARLKSGDTSGKKKKKGGNDFSAALAKAAVYEDYRKLIEKEKTADAIIIASGQHWHLAMSKLCLQAGKHVFCEKPLAHSAAEAREIANMMPGCKLATQIGTQGGATDTFRRSMEIIQAGVLGQIREVHCWINRFFPPSEAVNMQADPIPEGLNWDFWCGPSRLLPFKEYYLGGCLKWGRWFEFGDGHLADMGAHAHNLPLRALKLGPPVRITPKFGEPIKDSYPSWATFRWDFAAREHFDPVSVWWHDGEKAGPPDYLTADLKATYGSVPTNGVLFIGEKGILCSDAWGRGGVMRLKDDANPKCRGVLDHEAAKSVPVTYPRCPDQNHMLEWLLACKGGPKTFQGFDIAAQAAEFGMTGIVALRVGQPIEWDSQNLKAKGCPEADRFIHLPVRKKWLA
ncbi:MAG: Gfo/Idh/MocA family oxidoreductase [Verrucomicrobiae bacterium]|nr:Gfo/Idh/MocA family oxidoreductase [Verrucomicrobiae bacterium]